MFSMCATTVGDSDEEGMVQNDKSKISGLVTISEKQESADVPKFVPCSQARPVGLTENEFAPVRTMKRTMWRTMLRTMWRTMQRTKPRTMPQTSPSMKNTLLYMMPVQLGIYWQYLFWSVFVSCVVFEFGFCWVFGIIWC